MASIARPQLQKGTEEPLGPSDAVMALIPRPQHEGNENAEEDLGPRGLAMASVVRPQRKGGEKAEEEDLELEVLVERLRLLESQRELAALRCQKFTHMLETALLQPQGQWEQRYWSTPCPSPPLSDCDSDCPRPDPAAFPTHAYYTPPTPSRHRRPRSQRRHHRSSLGRANCSL